MNSKSMLVLMALFVSVTLVHAEYPSAPVDSVLYGFKNNLNKNSKNGLSAEFIGQTLVVFQKTGPGAQQRVCEVSRDGSDIKFEVPCSPRYQKYREFDNHWTIANYRDEYAKFRVRDGSFGFHKNIGGYQWFTRDRSDLSNVQLLEKQILSARDGINAAIDKAVVEPIRDKKTAVAP